MKDSLVTLVQAKVTTVIVCAAIILAMLGVTWWHMETTRQQILENNALTSAKSYANTFESLRTFYTKEVVARVPKDSWLKFRTMLTERHVFIER